MATSRFSPVSKPPISILASETSHATCHDIPKSGFSVLWTCETLQNHENVFTNLFETISLVSSIDLSLSQCMQKYIEMD